MKVAPNRIAPIRAATAPGARIELTATTNTNALANPATVRSSSHPIVVGSSGIAARVTTNTISDARHATVDRASRGDAVPASAPAR
jgi:hypothetical protein